MKTTTDIMPSAPATRRTLDPLLIAARVLLYILLAGTVLALVMGIIGTISTTAVQMSTDTVSSNAIWWSLAGRLIGLAALGLVVQIVIRLLAMIAAVDRGTAFAEKNADRLTAIAGTMLGLQVLGLLGRLVGAPIRGDINGFHIAFDLTPSGVAVVLLLFVLARVFRQGAAMRSDLEGTV